MDRLRRGSFRNAHRRRRGQAIFVFMLGLAMVAMILSNVFLFMEYGEGFHEKNDTLKLAQEAADQAKLDMDKTKADIKKLQDSLKPTSGKK